MPITDMALSAAIRLAPVLLVVCISLLVLSYLNKTLRRRWEHQPNMHFRFQMTMLMLTFFAFILTIVALPISDTLRGQLFSLIGILLSAAIALSSTTFIGNILAGIMLRVIKSACPGDFISVENLAGRITEMSLLHVEVQTEDRDLVTIPNMFVVTQPMKVVRATGTIVSAEVSLGYDVPRGKIKELLCQAAAHAGLKDGFVQVLELGDYSVLYRCAGLLEDVQSLISARSTLRASILDYLHGAGIEIVSPTFMNTRAFDKHAQFIPAWNAPREQESVSIESVVFDKADVAASVEALMKSILKIDKQLGSLENTPDDASFTIKEQLLSEKATLSEALLVAKAKQEKLDAGDDAERL